MARTSSGRVLSPSNTTPVRGVLGVAIAGLLLASLVLVPRTASARNIRPGQDFFETQEGSYIGVDIGPGFFYPTSDPFRGPVPVVGRPSVPGSNADTVIQRNAEARHAGPLPVSDTIPIELVELSLVSTHPIIVTSGGSPMGLWDVQVNILGPQPQGSMTITKTHANGGTFTATFTVQPLFVFTEVGGPGQQTLDCTPPPGGASPCPLYQFQATDEPWFYKAPRELGELFMSRGFCPCPDTGDYNEDGNVDLADVQWPGLLIERPARPQ